MLNGITLGIIIVFLLLGISFVLTLLINFLLVPLVRTPKEVLEEVVDMMNLSKEDRLADLGSGDGRFLLKAHKYSMCKCTGYDISPIMLIIAKTRRYLQFPFSKDILFEAEDIFSVDIEAFTKIYCYLDEKSIDILKEKFKSFVLNGGEIYSYRYEIPGIEHCEKIVLSNEVPLYIYRDSKEDQGNTRVV